MPICGDVNGNVNLSAPLRNNGPVEASLAAVGGILLLLAVSGGIKRIKTKDMERDEFVPLGDRIAATLLGGALVGLAAVLQAGHKGTGLWVTLGLGGAVVFGYAGYLWREYRRDKKRQRDKQRSALG